MKVRKRENFEVKDMNFRAFFFFSMRRGAAVRVRG
jgi:hypothetical protein